MICLSTRGQAPPVSLREAIRAGLAPDGGLYVPARLPALAREEWTTLSQHSLADVASGMLEPLFADDLAPGDLRRLLGEALNFPTPLVPLDDRLAVLELFHGPTFAFKDVGARVLARLLSHFHEEGQPPLTVLVATSGDTGGAVAHAFHGVPRTRVVVLYPDGHVSAVQEAQFTTLGGNVRAIAVEGTFDDCQRLAKQAFASPDLRTRAHLTSANSISLGRLLPADDLLRPERHPGMGAGAARHRGTERKLRQYRRRPDGAANGCADRPPARGDDRERHRAALSRHRTPGAAAVGVHACQRHGRRRSQQSRADSVDVRRRHRGPPRRDERQRAHRREVRVAIHELDSAPWICRGSPHRDCLSGREALPCVGRRAAGRVPLHRASGEVRRRRRSGDRPGGRGSRAAGRGDAPSQAGRAHPAEPRGSGERSFERPRSLEASHARSSHRHRAAPAEARALRTSARRGGRFPPRAPACPAAAVGRWRSAARAST